MRVSSNAFYQADTHYTVSFETENPVVYKNRMLQGFVDTFASFNLDSVKMHPLTTDHLVFSLSLSTLRNPELIGDIYFGSNSSVYLEHLDEQIASETEYVKQLSPDWDFDRLDDYRLDVSIDDTKKSFSKLIEAVSVLGGHIYTVHTSPNLEIPDVSSIDLSIKVDNLRYDKNKFESPNDYFETSLVDVYKVARRAKVSELVGCYRMGDKKGSMQ